MANITVTHTFVNGTPADATEVNTNFSDIIAGTSDGTKDFSISALTVAGTANFSGAVNLNGATTTLGNAITDSIVFTGRVASDIDPITTATYSFGSTSVTWKDLYLDNGVTDGGAIYFNASSSSFIKSDAAGTDLDISGFTNLDLNGLAITGAAGASFDGAVVINESGADVDFRVEGDTKTNLLFVDASTDNLGINQSAPTSQLHIKSDAANDVNSGFLFEAAGNTDKLLRLYQESAAVDTRARMELYFANTATHVFDTGSHSYINTGNFAIGSTSPTSERLRVVSQAVNSRVFSWKGTDDSRDMISYTSNSGAGDGILDVFAGSETGTNAVKVRLNSNGDSYFLGGDVGIGTSSPGSALEVSGTLTLKNTLEIGTQGSTNGFINCPEGLFISLDTGTSSAGDQVFDISDGQSSTSRFKVTQAGTVNISGLTASSDVQTDGSKNLISTSDMRLKNNLGELESGLDIVNQLKPTYYTWKSNPEAHRELGFMAQETHKVLPEAAPYSEEEDRWGFNTRAVVACLTKAVQELSAKVDALESKLAG